MLQTGKLSSSVGLSSSFIQKFATEASDAKSLYLDARSFQDLLNLNIEFLKGSLPSPIYGFSEQYLDFETLSFLDELVECNRLGFMTTDSQQGFIDYFPSNQSIYDAIYQELLKTNGTLHGGLSAEGHGLLLQRYKENGGSFNDKVLLSQRSYVAGFMETDRALKLSSQLNLIEGIVSFSIPCSMNTAGMRIPVTFEAEQFTEKNGFAELSSLEPVTFLDSTSQLERYRPYISTDLFSHLEQQFSSLVAFDTTHGRSAETYLFKNLLNLLQ